MCLLVTDHHEMMLPTNWKYWHPMCMVPQGELLQ